MFYLLSLLAQTRFTSCHIHNFFPKYSHFSEGKKKKCFNLSRIVVGEFFLPGGVREMVGISLGKGYSGLKSHLVELVMRADMRLRLGRRRILLFYFGFCLHGQVWIMPCVEDGPMYQRAVYNFIVAVLFKSFPQVCERDERAQQCNILLIHISVHVCMCV